MARRVTCPILVVNGELDPWAGEPSAREFADVAPHCLVEVIPGAGHAPWLDKPDLVEKVLRGFIEDTSHEVQGPAS